MARAGASSRPITSHPKPSLGGISAVSSTDIFAIGGNGKGNFPQVLQFNGTTWTSLANLPTGIADTAIDAISATDVWTVGDGSIWNFNGTSWTEVASGLGGDLVAISGSSANNIFAVGETISTTDETLVEQWNGTSWSTVTSAGAGELTRSDNPQQRDRRGGRCPRHRDECDHRGARAPRPRPRHQSFGRRSR